MFSRVAVTPGRCLPAGSVGCVGAVCCAAPACWALCGAAPHCLSARRSQVSQRGSTAPTPSSLHPARRLHPPADHPTHIQPSPPPSLLPSFTQLRPARLGTARPGPGPPPASAPAVKPLASSARQGIRQEDAAAHGAEGRPQNQGVQAAEVRALTGRPRHDVPRPD